MKALKEKIVKALEKKQIGHWYESFHISNGAPVERISTTANIKPKESNDDNSCISYCCSGKWFFFFNTVHLKAFRTNVAFEPLNYDENNDVKTYTNLMNLLSSCSDVTYENIDTLWSTDVYDLNTKRLLDCRK
ncbi:unnamed protein product [Cercopithifilaria johnstoni]|uniref:Uncharacterized protein n=1 Tax=Cercopithifilaria johnstoni TaxID=2874296 RepID=A0A8J2M281_9BILA|nr:unnamed protein product [Cercopithifilaria johnstoni]